MGGSEPELIVKESAELKAHLKPRLDPPVFAHPYSQAQRGAGNLAIQRYVHGSQGMLPGIVAMPSVEKVLRSPGQPIDDNPRKEMEARFGFDFRSVRVHTDANAGESARALSAVAYTVGQDVVFGAGQFSPHSSRGKWLLAHELAHVVQQAGGLVEGGALSFGDQRLEAEAERTANDTIKAEMPASPAKHSLSKSGSPVPQRVTDQPELQAGIGVGSAVGSATVGFITTCLMRAGLVQLAGMMAYRVVRILSASGARRTQLINELVGSWVIPMAIWTSFCDCMPPQLIAALAQWGLGSYPDALAHLDHYLNGSGTPYIEDIPRLLSEDSGVKATIERGIRKVGMPSGDLRDWVTQESYSTKNWVNALGNVDLFHYEILQDSASKTSNAAASDGTAAVRISIRDPYEWHPDEFRQIPCLHTGMEAMKAGGAKDFLSLGDGVIRLNVPSTLIPLP